MKVAVAELMLGYTRVQGLVVYNSASKEFNEIPPAQARRLIDEGDLFGVKYEKTEDGIRFLCDEGFSQEDLMIKTACGKYRSMNNEIIGSSILNSIYTVVKKIEYTDKSFYEIVGTKCSRLIIPEDKLVELNNISHIAGCWIDDQGNIKLHDAIPVVKRDITYNENILEVDVDISSNRIYQITPNPGSDLEKLFNTKGFEGEDLEEPTPEELREAFPEKKETPKPKTSTKRKKK